MKVPDFEAWALFVSVAERGSFAGAARALGLSVPTVSRGVARLEARLGGRLFHRSSRRLALSALGADALPEAQALVAVAAGMEERLGEARTIASGLVRLAAPMDFGLAHLGPLLPDFLVAHPGISIDLHLDDARVDIVAGGHDLVLRIGRLQDSSLIARRLCGVRLLTVASPAYLAQAGRPAHPAELGRHRCLIYSNSPQARVWRYEGPAGKSWSATVDGPIMANNGGLLVAAAVQGLGIALSPEFRCWWEIADGTLEALLPGWAPAELGLYMVTPPGPLRPLRVRLLMDYLAAWLATPPWQVG